MVCFGRNCAVEYCPQLGGGAQAKKHLVSFLSLKEIVGKYGLCDSELKIYQMATKLAGKSDNFAITTKDYWKPDPSLPEGTGRGINSMYSLVFCIANVICFIH